MEPERGDGAEVLLLEVQLVAEVGGFSRVSSARTPRTAIATRSLGLLAAGAAIAAIAAPAAGAMATSAKATSEVQKWTSKKSFHAPYAFVEVIHAGRNLERTAITRCKGQYADKDLTVQISTCGPRWRVRAAYVSMNGRKEAFRIVYAPRDNA